MPLSTAPERGKGYQEFEMIDRLVLDETTPAARLLKITGRYIYRNIDEILDAIRQRMKTGEDELGLMIDQCRRSEMARTSLFCVTPAFYRANLRSIHQLCDDRRGDWIERVLYQRLRNLPPEAARQVCLFPVEPDQTGISGSTGGQLEISRFKYAVKRRLRMVNLLVDRRYLWYAR